MKSYSSGATIQADFSGFELEILPPEIDFFTNLESLNLADTGLTMLPSEIGHLTQLTNLSLQMNKIGTLPPEFDQLKQLRILDIRDTLLEDLKLVYQLDRIPYLLCGSFP